ncbi:hypothetical protein PUMCH_005158 [Australozyma saopauloensis]|uniref:Oxidoreductase n=1 Tax=Australozyma saopauloensis TaxID=291208 RepID=A0AAX4HGK4_9ASCO|nr:hypothetical protein PUMCH_005158 [[Candida] saopauloensis]
MPIDILSSAIFDGPETIPGWSYIKTYVPIVTALGAAKYYFGGSANTSDRNMHGRVFIVTGGTSGLGAEVVYQLAQRGAQVVLLCRLVQDQWTVDFIDDMREKTNNNLVFAELCDLLLLHSVRQFATTWLDSSTPRRLDGVVCCAADCTPRGSARSVTVDGAERQMAVNYLAHYHLLTLLRPSMHVQPPDRDVRIVLTTCSSQALGPIDRDDFLWEKRAYPQNAPWKVYGASKLLLGIFGRLLQRDLLAYERPDSAPCNIQVSIVNPGIMRTASTRRALSFGTIWGLLLYILLFPVWFIFFKNSYEGVQSVLFALFAPVFGPHDGGNLIQECKILTKGREEYYDYELQDQIFKYTAEAIDTMERNSAIERKKEEKRLGLDKVNEKKRVDKMRDLSQKPTTTEELEQKLLAMRELMNFPLGNPKIEAEVLAQASGRETKKIQPKKKGKRKL